MSMSLNTYLVCRTRLFILNSMILISVGNLSACDEEAKQETDPCAEDICGEGTRCLNGFCVPLRQKESLDLGLMPQQDMSEPDRSDADLPIDMLIADAEVIDADILDAEPMDVELPDAANVDMAEAIDMMPCEASEEVCDLEDNDCDGVIDEEDPLVGQSCETTLVGPCLEGIYTCRGGSLSCDGLQQPDYEVCDALDNDCDGLTDEGVYPVDLPPNADQAV